MTNSKEEQEKINPELKEAKRETHERKQTSRGRSKIPSRQEKTTSTKQENKQKQSKVVKKENNFEKVRETKEERGIKPQRRPRRNTRIKEDVRIKKSPLKIIPLGGLLEIGKNMTVFEYENEIVIVDCGLAFPTEDMLGVDLVVADTTYLEKNKEKIRGLVITHGHEDHIGGIPYLLRQVNVPIYATRFTLGLLRNKLDEHRLLKSTKLHEVPQGATVDFGKIKVEFIRTSHSIPDAVGFAIYTPVGTVVHTGDFKIDYTPIDGQKIDFARISEIRRKRCNATYVR